VNEMNETNENIKPEVEVRDSRNVTTKYIVEEIEFKSSPEAQSAVAEALDDIQGRSFAKRNPQFGKMFNCRFCGRRHRDTDVTYRESYDENGKVGVKVEAVRTERCKQTFKELWIDEDVETGERTTQYATVPLPGQNPTPKAIVGAAYFHKKRKSPRPNATGNQIVELTRKIFATINPERFPEEAGRMLEAKRIAVNTLRNKREREAKRVRQQQRASRRANRGR
jgi:hypothetical protein